MLEIKDLTVTYGSKVILKNINLKIEKGTVHALLGPNAAGKSTLAKVIVGFPKYKVVTGSIFFRGRDVTNLPMEERAKLGVSMVFQDPPAVKNVKLKELLQKISRMPLDNLIKKVKFNDVIEELLEREVNVDFSGGEKKISEIIQVLSMRPRFLILDELDSGLDLVNLRKITFLVKDEFLNRETSLLIITHRGEILHFLEPCMAHVMVDGEIVCSGDWRDVWKVISTEGYEKCIKCKGKTPLLTERSRSQHIPS
ncbi:MAG: ABC transporter ATP-binding protein [Candidatus Baldrarchaeia archaeon]